MKVLWTLCTEILCVNAVRYTIVLYTNYVHPLSYQCFIAVVIYEEASGKRTFNWW